MHSEAVWVRMDSRLSDVMYEVVCAPIKSDGQ